MIHVIGECRCGAVRKVALAEPCPECGADALEMVRALTWESTRVARALSWFWSIDFARTRDGLWWLIDMAAGDQSWHPESCPTLPARGVPAKSKPFDPSEYVEEPE